PPTWHMMFPPRSALVAKCCRGFATVPKPMIGARIAGHAMTAVLRRVSCTSSVATWSDVRAVVDRRFTASAPTMTVLSTSHAQRPNQAMKRIATRLKIRFLHASTANPPRSRCRFTYFILVRSMKPARWLFVMLLLAAAHAQDEAPLADKAAALPPEIETVASGGFWSRDGHDGSFRLIIQVLGWDDLYNRAFLQWIRIDPDKQETVVERTVSIKEIAGRWRISSQKFVYRRKQTVIVISAKRHAPPARAIFTMVPSADFSYTIT